MDDPSHYQNPSYYFRYNARGDASFIANDDSKPGASGGDTLTYDQENRLTSITVGANATAYAYDGDGNRVKKTGNGISAFYVGNYYDGASSHTPRRDGRHVCSCNNTSAQTALRAVVPPGIYKEKKRTRVARPLAFPSHLSLLLNPIVQSQSASRPSPRFHSVPFPPDPRRWRLRLPDSWRF